MLGLVDVKDWIKEFGIGENFYIGKLDNKKDKSVGIYQRKADIQPFIPVGGIQKATYEVKPISILIHWNKNANQTEIAAHSMFEKIINIEKVTINSMHINYIKILNAEPIDVGTDDKGVYERVIQIDLIYER